MTEMHINITYSNLQSLQVFMCFCTNIRLMTPCHRFFSSSKEKREKSDYAK